MKEMILERLKAVWEAHPITLVTTSVGIFIGIFVLLIGFWATLFLLMTGFAGFVIGRWLEADKSRLDSFIERMDEILRR